MNHIILLVTQHHCDNYNQYINVFALQANRYGLKKDEVGLYDRYFNIENSIYLNDPKFDKSKFVNIGLLEI